MKKNLFSIFNSNKSEDIELEFEKEENEIKKGKVEIKKEIKKKSSLNSSVVIDLGTFNIKFGHSGDDEFKNLRSIKCFNKKKSDSFYFEKEITKDFLGYENLISQDNMFQNYDDLFFNKFEELLNLKLPLDKLLTSCKKFKNSKLKNKLIEILYETFECKKLYLENSSLLSLFTSGRDTGFLIDVGHSNTKLVPIFENTILSGNTNENLKIGGKLLINYFLKKFHSNERVNELKYSEFYRKFIEKECFLNDFNYIPPTTEEYIENKITPRKCLNTELILPDGKKINIKNEKINSTEILFNTTNGINLEFFNLMKSVNEKYYKRLYGNVILVGGCSNLLNFSTRLEFELIKNKKNMATKVINFAQPEFTSCIGASIMSGLDSFDNYFITFNDYKEGNYFFKNV